MSGSIIDAVNSMVRMTTDESKPNINDLWLQLKDLNAIKWTVKQQGYAIASQIYDEIKKIPVPQAPENFSLPCKASTQSDLQSDWFVYWMSELKSAPVPHRKLWEFAWILQNLYSRNLISAGKKGLGFGCGEEPLPSYFASHGVEVTVTDLAPEEVAGKGWAETGQHTGTIEASLKEKLVSREAFNQLVSLEFVDMNNIPSNLNGLYDFCWSVCALEHLGSIAKGLDFIENSLATLKPGGVALHTTEFNYTEENQTVDNWETVLFLKSHFSELAVRLAQKGYIVSSLDFDVGSDPLDNFIDLPPYKFQEFATYKPFVDGKGYRPGHLKLSINGFPSTCFGFVVERPN